MKKKILAILFIIMVVAVLSVQIFAKPQAKLVQDVEKNFTIEKNYTRLSNCATSTKKASADVDVKLDKAQGSVNKVSVKKEKPKSRIKFSDALNVENVDEPKLEKTGTTLNAVVRKGAEAKQQAHIKLKDISGDEVANIVADYGQLTESEKSRIEKGEAVLRSIRSLRIQSNENDASITDAKGNKHRIKGSINVNLKSINDDSSLDITADNNLDENIKNKFENVAKDRKIKLLNRGGVLKVEKTALKNGQEIQNATVTFKVEPEWIGEDNINNVKIMRFDEESGTSQVLPTQFSGVDEEGMLVFDGVSKDGLSTFAIFMTESIAPTEQDTKFSWSSLKAFILPLLLIVTIGAAYVGSVVRREN
jgi:PGF-pre-PGF domain-containing protein